MQGGAVEMFVLIVRDRSSYVLRSWLREPPPYSFQHQTRHARIRGLALAKAFVPMVRALVYNPASRFTAGQTGE